MRLGWEWALSIVLGAAMFAIAIVVADNPTRYWPAAGLSLMVDAVAFLFIGLGAFAPKGWAVSLGVLAGMIAVLMLAAAGVPWRVPDSCNQPGVTCEGNDGGLVTMVLGVAALVSAWLGALLQAVWRRSRRRPVPPAPEDRP